jgi:hypothetical protein
MSGATNSYDDGRKPSFAEGTQSSSNEVMVNVSLSNWSKIPTCVGFISPQLAKIEVPLLLDPVAPDLSPDAQAMAVSMSIA